MLKSEFREIELQEKTINERLHLYDLDKNQLMEEQQQKTARLVELEELLAQCSIELSQVRSNNCSTDRTKARLKYPLKSR